MYQILTDVCNLKDLDKYDKLAVGVAIYKNGNSTHLVGHGH